MPLEKEESLGIRDLEKRMTGNQGLVTGAGSQEGHGRKTD